MLDVDDSENAAAILSLDSIRHALFNPDLLCLDLLPTILLCSHKQFKGKKKIIRRTQTKDGRGGPQRGISNNKIQSKSLFASLVSKPNTSGLKTFQVSIFSNLLVREMSQC